MSMQCILNNMYHKLKSILTDLGRYKECWLNMLTYLTLMSIVDTQIFFLVQFSFALYLFHLPLKGLSMIFNSCLSPDSFKSLISVPVCLSIPHSVCCMWSQFSPTSCYFQFHFHFGTVCFLSFTSYCHVTKVCLLPSPFSVDKFYSILYFPIPNYFSAIQDLRF